MHVNTDDVVKKKGKRRFVCADGIVQIICIVKEKFSLVRVRVELTTLALSAPRSADWANGPAVERKAKCLALRKKILSVLKPRLHLTLGKPSLVSQIYDNYSPQIFLTCEMHIVRLRL